MYKIKLLFLLPIDSEMIDAARTQKTELLKCLIRKGANINAEKEGITALIYAAAYGSFDIVKFLIENGADVNAENSDGQSVLAFAASSAYTAAILGPEDHEQMVKYLITKGNSLYLVLHLHCPQSLVFGFLQ